MNMNIDISNVLNYTDELLKNYLNLIKNNIDKGIKYIDKGLNKFKLTEENYKNSQLQYNAFVGTRNIYSSKYIKHITKNINFERPKIDEIIETLFHSAKLNENNRKTILLWITNKMYEISQLVMKYFPNNYNNILFKIRYILLGCNLFIQNNKIQINSDDIKLSIYFSFSYIIDDLIDNNIIEFHIIETILKNKFDNFHYHYNEILNDNDNKNKILNVISNFFGEFIELLYAKYDKNMHVHLKNIFMDFFNTNFKFSNIYEEDILNICKKSLYTRLLLCIIYKFYNKKYHQNIMFDCFLRQISDDIYDYVEDKESKNSILTKYTDNVHKTIEYFFSNMYILYKKNKNISNIIIGNLIVKTQHYNLELFDTFPQIKKKLEMIKNATHNWYSLNKNLISISNMYNLEHLKQQYKIYIGNNIYFNEYIYGIDSELIEIINYSLKGGKYTRGFMFYIICNCLTYNSVPFDMLPIIKSIEFAQSASLILDDIQDKGVMRRDVQCAYLKYGTDKAMLAYTIMITEFYKYLTEYDKCSELVKICSKYVGYNGLVSGQFLDLYEKQETLSIDRYFRLARLKTSKAFEIITSTASVLLNLDEKTRTNLNVYSENFGIAYQLKDDISENMTSDKYSLRISPSIIDNKIKIESYNKARSICIDSLLSIGLKIYPLIELTMYVLPENF